MRPVPGKLNMLLALVTVSAVIGVACSSGDPPTPTAQSAQPISFPYIFSGKFTVNGGPGPADIPMFARLGDGRGPFNNTVRPGEYTNVSISPSSTDDIGGEVTFYLGHPDGPTVQAEETFTFSPTSQPQFVTLDLSFPRLP